MAPLYVSCFSNKELNDLASANLGLLPGCEELFRYLHEDWNIFVISTSYTQFAHNVTSALNISKDHVYCTNLNIQQLKNGLTNIDETVNILVKVLFQKYLDNNKRLDSVIKDLNNFFWKGEESDYIKVMNQVEVRGGKRKELAIEDISKRTGIPISNMIAIGDSITDINMLQRLKDEGGVAVSFNGNRYTAERANIAITTPNNLGVLPIFESKDNIEEFLARWESEFDAFKTDPKRIPDDLISRNTKNIFISNNFVPEIVNLSDKSKKEIDAIISKQEEMRKLVRGWAGKLG
jgi:energy-converting hydrogenase A subunit R